MVRIRKFFLPLIVVLLIFSVVVNIVALHKMDSMHIMGYDSLGLFRLDNELDKKTITGMYVSAEDNPNLTGEFYNEEALADLLEIMKTGCYQSASDPHINYSVPGAASYPFIRIETENGIYGIAVIAHRVSITIQGETKWYYSDVNVQISDAIREIAMTELETAG